MSSHLYDLEPEICALVGHGLPKSAGGAADFITVELVGSLVRMGLDALVSRYGAQGEMLSQAAKTQIRTFVSASTLRYLEGIAAGLQDLKAIVPRQAIPPSS